VTQHSSEHTGTALTMYDESYKSVMPRLHDATGCLTNRLYNHWTTGCIV